MKIDIHCQICGEPLRADTTMLGRYVKCPGCGGRALIDTGEPAARLVLSKGPADRASKLWLFRDRPNNIGKAPNNTIILVSELVSRRHAQIIWTPKGWEIADLGSTNGTWVNGERVGNAIIHPGDNLRIGEFEARLEAVEPAAASATAPSTARPQAGSAPPDPLAELAAQAGAARTDGRPAAESPLSALVDDSAPLDEADASGETASMDDSGQEEAEAPPASQPAAPAAQAEEGGDPADALAALAAASVEAGPKRPIGAPAGPPLVSPPPVTSAARKPAKTPRIPPPLPTPPSPAELQRKRYLARRNRKIGLGVAAGIAVIGLGWWLLPTYLAKRAALRYAPRSCFAVLHVDVERLRTRLPAFLPTDNSLAEALRAAHLPPREKWDAYLDRIRAVSVYLCEKDEPAPEIVVALRGDFDLAMLTDILPIDKSGGKDTVLTRSSSSNGRYGIGPAPHMGWLVLGAESDDMAKDVVWIRLSVDPELVTPAWTNVLGGGVQPGLDQVMDEVNVRRPVWVAGEWPKTLKRPDGLLRIAGDAAPFDPLESRLILTFAGKAQAERADANYRRWARSRGLADFLEVAKPERRDEEIGFSAVLGDDADKFVNLWVQALLTYAGQSDSEATTKAQTQPATRVK